jgi:hypothetical protein
MIFLDKSKKNYFSGIQIQDCAFFQSHPCLSATSWTLRSTQHKLDFFLFGQYVNYMPLSLKLSYQTLPVQEWVLGEMVNTYKNANLPITSTRAFGPFYVWVDLL